jgi:chemotaxis methyl-accepting protein methylase
MEESGASSTPGDAARLIAQVERERGIDLSQYRLTYVERRLGTRLRALGLVTYRQYGQYLSEHPTEYTAMLDTLTVNVTDFFRDPPVWKIVRHEVIPAILKDKGTTGHRAIRIWSAGCATGEEPYSLAMAFLAEMGKQSDSYLMSVTATDLDPIALRTAQRAEYDVAKLDHIPAPERVRFTVTEGKKFTIKPEVTEHVRFRKTNLFSDEPPLAVDLILCRNVFIYFTREQQERITNVFHRALARGGYLVLGRTEKMANGAAAGFEAISSKERIYRKIQ